ncbi:hypothetical protein [Caenibius sp. WL]|uniref:hypothetical protein n=1 Tax=Caenibius sp. WL TaxID=2872646 RepID=UPI001C9971DB|nr:hypothetical protein [Caenibius sp. WL]QZP06885.1 hypothetical protein K5X80_09125 [Caenibius sp. WL]
MKIRTMILAATGSIVLAGCASNDPPPPPPGAVPGSVAADRDGDGIIDGYYTSDGVYHPNYVPPPPPPPPPSRTGERG